MFKIEKLVPSAEEIIKSVPLPKNLKAVKDKCDKAVSDIIRGDSSKMLVIVGPCSAHESAPVLDYVKKLGQLSEKVKDVLVLIPRIYTNKPRTKGVGYKGMFSQPDPAGKADIVGGIVKLREMHIKSMELGGLSAADEMLYPENYAYVEDLLTYIAVGARSSENQMHRLVSSGIELPVGIKNPMSGSIAVTLNSVYAAQCGHTFKYHSNQVTTSGNELAHVVLRGAVDSYGNNKPNFHYEDVMEVIEGYDTNHLKNPAIIIDANHSNSDKQFKQQIRIANEVMQNRKYSKDFKRYVKGFMLESFLEEGCDSSGSVYGKSITDACLSWEDTERLIYSIADLV